MNPVSYEMRGTTAILTIDRPERRNAVDPETAGALLEGCSASRTTTRPGCWS